MDRLPVALFVFNRPEHARKTIQSLSRNTLADKTDLFVFADGARNERDAESVKQVRELLRSEPALKKFGSVQITERAANLGLAKSIIDGVGTLIDKFGVAIVLEDDIVTSPHFLEYMRDALVKYQDEERVMHVSSYMFPVSNQSALPETFFYRATTCWGWATWARAWKKFNPDAKRLLGVIEREGRKKQFDIEGSAHYHRMLKDNSEGRNNSWAVRWYASVLLSNGLCLHPRASLSANIGNDGTGVHCGVTNDYDVALSPGPVRVGAVPIEESAEAVAGIAEFYRAQMPSVIQRISRRLGLSKS